MSDANDEKLYSGIVVWFSGSYGFIEWEIEGVKQNDLFCYWSDISNQEGKFKTLKKDQKVSFNIGKNNRGQDKAINVSVLT